MNYKKVVFTGHPLILFSQKHETKSYDYYIPERTPCFEISYVDEGDTMIYPDGGIPYERKAGTLGVGTTKPCHVTSLGKFHRHVTVAIGGHFSMESLSLNELQWQFSQTNATNGFTTIFMPDSIDDPIKAQKGRSIIEHIIYERNLPQINQIKVTSLLFQLLDLFHSSAIDDALHAASLPYSDIAHCQKAIQYISHHRKEVIRVDQLASYLGLSEAYLCRIFKTVTGHTVIQYVNTLKINMIKELLVNRSLPLSQLAIMVGITDEKYMCRLFKKYTGMTISSYKSVKMPLPTKESSLHDSN